MSYLRTCRDGVSRVETGSVVQDGTLADGSPAAARQPDPLLKSAENGRGDLKLRLGGWFGGFLFRRRLGLGRPRTPDPRRRTHLWPLSFGRWDDPKATSPPDAVCREVPRIRCEYQVRSEVFCQHDEGRIGEVHRQIGIVFHQVAAAAKRGGAGGNKGRAPIEKKVEACSSASSNAAQQMSRLGQHRLAADDAPFPALEEAGALLMKALAAIEEGNETAGVEEQLTGHAPGSRERMRGVARPDPEPQIRLSR